MIIDLTTNFAYKCPACYSFHVQQLNVFDIPQNKSKQLHCECKFSYAAISNTKRNYTLSVPCFICGEQHNYRISSKRLWKNDLLILGCTASNLDVCAFGNGLKIEKWIDEYSSMLDTIMENDFEE